METVISFRLRLFQIHIWAISMGRTKKDITVTGRTAEEVMTAIQKWFSENKVEVIENKPNSIKGRWGTGFLTASKYFQISFLPTDGGIVAQTEGWITWYWLREQEFSSTAFAGGVPRREGWRAMERLWSTLQSLSKC
jgi:hypothetical protein